MEDRRLLDIFVTESDDLLAELERCLVAIEEQAGDPELVHGAFRVAHTLKGNAGMVGLESIVEITHVLESLLGSFREGTLAPSSESVSELLQAVDIIRSMVAEVEAGDTPALSPEAKQLVSSIGARTATPAIPAPVPEHTIHHVTGPRVFDITINFPSDIFDSGTDPAMLVEELAGLGEFLECQVFDHNLPKLDDLNTQRFYLQWHILLRTEHTQEDIETVFLFQQQGVLTIRDVSAAHHNGIDIAAAEKKLGELLLESGAVKPQDLNSVLSQQKRVGELLVESGKVPPGVVDKLLEKQHVARKAQRNSSIRVDTDKLDKLVNLVGEMVITVSQVGARSRNATQRQQQGLLSAVESLEQITKDLQDRVLSLRMVPVEDMFSRFQRPVRDIAAQLGKYVALETSGTETELDKNVIEALVDPLKHMVRNAIAHGIERPEERIAAGKSDTGRVHLKAYQREGYIVIEVIDDGRGIDPEAVIDKAKRRGLVTEDQALDEQQVYQLLFEPGFSTAAVVDEVSGRGVGLDVVKRNVEELKGRIDVESVFGKGTTFRLRLPLTLAIVDGMLVRVAEETIAVPLLSVLELVEPSKDNLKPIEGKGEVVDVRGELLPIVYLGSLLDFSANRAITRDSKVVVLQSTGKKFGLLVDGVLGMEQTVIKPLDKSFLLVNRLDDSYERPDGIAGATILGDGTVGLILDVVGVEKMAFGKKQQPRLDVA